jgi:Tol biopolymer transport system component
VKVLDFGLAKAAEERPVDAQNSPTMTMSPTRAGMILGTVAYMSPEQARGKAVDKRADIWAFGCVLYEMLSGRPAFAGETITDVLAAVVKSEPDWNAVPQKVRRLLASCMEKDPKRRLQAIGDYRLLLEEQLQAGSLRHSRLSWVVAAALAVIAIVAGVGWWRATRPVDRPLMRLEVDLGPDAVAGQFTTTAISPDGARLVFPVKDPDGKQKLATRLLGETKAAALSGTENGRDPFFSPDGKWIGFFADGKMKRIPVLGGAPVVLCDARNARGANWGDDGNIVAALGARGALSRIPAEGGTPQRVSPLTADLHFWPQPLPGSGAVLFTLSSGITFEDATIATMSLKTGEIKALVRGGYFGRYLPTSDSTGHLVYVHDGVLFAVPFDPARLELRGTAVPVVEDLAADPNSGAGQFSFSRSGSLVYRTGKVSAQSWPVWWLDNSGKTQPLIATSSFYMFPRVSPDGQRLAVLKIEGDDRRLFVYDWQRDTMSRLAIRTQQPTFPVWSRDGSHLVFGFLADGFGLGWVRADGAGEIQRLLDTKNAALPDSFFPDGRRLAYSEFDPVNSYDLWTLPLDLSDPDHPKPGKPELFLSTPANETEPAVSPDGRWIAYRSGESGRNEVYVRPFPGPGGKWQVSNAGGTVPIWSRNGREIFFLNLDSRIMVTDYTATRDSFVPGKPRLWSDQQVRDLGGIPNYDLAPDGKSFAIFPELKPTTADKGDVHMTFLLNFFDELRRRVPARE